MGKDNTFNKGIDVIASLNVTQDGLSQFARKRKCSLAYNELLLPGWVVATPVRVWIEFLESQPNAALVSVDLEEVQLTLIIHPNRAAEPKLKF
jgi:hypothetical protein